MRLKYNFIGLILACGLGDREVWGRQERVYTGGFEGEVLQVIRAGEQGLNIKNINRE